VTFTIRVTLEDRPGELAAIAAALGGIGANIVELDVLERSVDRAVDQLVVQAPGCTADEVRATIGAVEGTTVDSLRPTMRNAGLPPLGLAVRLASVPPEETLQVLVDGLVLTFEATWAAVLRRRTPQPAVVAGSAGTPGLVGVTIPWLPLRDVRRIPQGPWTPASWLRADEPLELAAAPLRSADEAVVVCRPYGPRFAQRELADVGLLADLAAAQLDGTPVPA
jgi:hypothetical protein